MGASFTPTIFGEKLAMMTSIARSIDTIIALLTEGVTVTVESGYRWN